jgi:uncharacterized YigZ family protein
MIKLFMKQKYYFRKVSQMNFTISSHISCNFLIIRLIFSFFCIELEYAEIQPVITGDTYKTIKSLSQGIYKDKGSRFISYAFPVSSVDEVRSLLDAYHKKYHDARHHCYAYMIGSEGTTWRTNDDGEPSGTAGKPILGQINSFGLTNILIIVVRYFGGTLLGTSGLIKAYKTAACEAITNSEIVECTVKVYYKIEFGYSSMNSVMRILKDEEITQTAQVFGLDCSINISFRLSAKDNILSKLSVIENIKLTHLETPLDKGFKSF